VHGNAGSFFQAAYVNADELLALKKRLASRGIDAEEVDRHLYGQENDIWKISPAWLVVLAGMRSATRGGAAIWEDNPAILINRTGLASSHELLELACRVCKRVFDAMELRLRIEPELVGFSERLDNGDLLEWCERVAVS